MLRADPQSHRLRIRPKHLYQQLSALHNRAVRIAYSSRFLYSAMDSGQLSRKIPRLTGIRTQPGSAT